MCTSPNEESGPLANNLPPTRALLVNRSPSLQFAMSAVVSGMSVPKVVHQLQVVRVARYSLQHRGETWLFNCQADPGMLYVYMDTDWWQSHA